MPEKCSPNAISLWTRYIDQILSASQHDRLDPQYQLQQITRDILHTITPRLDLSIRSLPLYNHRQYQTIFQKLQARREYLQNTQTTTTTATRSSTTRMKRDDIQKSNISSSFSSSSSSSTSASSSSPPPPLRILVMGGSLARGIMCNTGLPRYMDDKCSWPERLQLLLNYDYVTGQRYHHHHHRDHDNGHHPLLLLVEVYNVAVGGWNTAVSNTVLQYDLLSDQRHWYPDIIINAHSTNEMHANTVQNALARNQSHWDAAFDMTQDFIRTVLKRCCMVAAAADNNHNNHNNNQSPLNEPPLLIYFDDYLGNDQRSILDTTIASQGTHILAKYYGIGYVSFADVVRDIVYRQTNETIFSPHGWYKSNNINKNNNNNNMQREVHPGYGMHIASSFVLAYYLLTLAMSFLGMEEYYTQYHHNNNNKAQQQFTKLTTQSTGDTSLLPPKLDRSLLLDHISERYSDPNTAERRVCQQQQQQQQSSWQRKCPVSWLIEASPGSYSVEATMEYFHPYLVKSLPQEWVWFNAGIRQRPKYGFTPVPVVDKKLSGHLGPGTNRTMTLEFHYDDHDDHDDHDDNDQQQQQQQQQGPIQSVTVFYIQRNDMKWKGTEMTVSVFSLVQDDDDDDNNTGTSHQHPKQQDEKPKREALPLIAQTSITNYHPQILRDDKVKMTIDLIPPQSHFQIQFKHTGGVSFRMTGMAICH
jgi:hypothetical protein